VGAAAGGAICFAGGAAMAGNNDASTRHMNKMQAK